MHYFTKTEARCFTGDLTECHYFPITINKRQSCHKEHAKIYHSNIPEELTLPDQSQIEHLKDVPALSN